MFTECGVWGEEEDTLGFAKGRELFLK